ncbi:hypothetical protein [Bradyrhizobium sp. UNPA324]|uniref:hypothetical protein n=1 Tax=Bradyrhizobium sp. UNPA324 TaxID=1141174 RepID=UPI001152F32E|nr:hypothetical protein [Bradyrhizobium sp. UNPA324]
MDKIRDIFSYFVAAMAIFSLLGAVYQAFQNEKGSALTLGTLFLVGSLIVFLPQVEFIKTLGVEARLRETYKEAVATLANVKRLAEISARASYLVIAWGNRFDGPTAKERQAVLDQIDEQLAELKVSPERQAEIQRPFVQMVRLDFFFLFQGVLNQYATHINTKLTEDVHKAPDPSAAAGKVMEHSERITAWTKRVQDKNWSAELDKYSLENVLNDFVPKRGEWLTDKELGVFHKLKDEVVRLNTDCEKKGGYTQEAATYYDRYSGNHNVDKANQLRDEVLR